MGSMRSLLCVDVIVLGKDVPCFEDPRSGIDERPESRSYRMQALISMSCQMETGVHKTSIVGSISHRKICKQYKGAVMKVLVMSGGARRDGDGLFVGR